MKRLLALVLLLATVGMVFAGCTESDDSDTTTTGSNQGTTVPGTTAAGDISDVTTTAGESDNTTAPESTTTVVDDGLISDNPTLFFDNKDVSILSRSRDWFVDEIWSEGQTASTIGDAVFSRNAAVEKEIGVIIKNDMIPGDGYVVSTQMRTMMGSNDLTYDYFANSVYSTIMYTSEGWMADLTDMQYLEMDKPWWSQNFNEVASVGTSQYMVTGPHAISMYRFIFVTFFNKDLIETVLTDGTDLYQVVYDGNWSINYQTQLAEKFYEDNDSVQGKSEGDLFGFVTNGDQIGVDAYWSSCQLPILKKNADNYYELNMDVDRLADAVDKIIDLVYSDSSYSYAHTGSDAEQEDIRKKFANGGAAMTTLRLIEAESAELRNMKSIYGVLPIPKFNPKQEEYYAYAHDQMTAFGIPSWLPEEQLDRAGALLNSMGRHSLRIVRPAYYEIALKSKYMNDEKSWDMLDFIVDSLRIDAGVLYTKEIDSIHQKLRTIIGSGINNVASTFSDTQLERYSKLVDELNEGIEALEVK